MRKFRKQHCCSLDSVHRRCRKVSAKLIGDLITPKLQVSGQSMKPKEIQAEIQVNYGVVLPYNQCRRAKDHAEDNVFGSAELSFEQLPAYCYQLELANPGTVTNIETNDSNHDRTLPRPYLCSCLEDPAGHFNGLIETDLSGRRNPRSES